VNAVSQVRAEAAAQVALMLGVGSVAACASWSHVVSLAAGHGQPGWLAVADAAVVETLAVSMGLEVRRRRRMGEPAQFAVCVLVAAVALQLSAQVAQAPRTFWGWTMAALPAIGFLLLAKVAIARGPLVARDPGPDASALANTLARANEVETISAYDVMGSRDPSVPPASPGAGSQPHVSLNADLLAAGRAVAAELVSAQVALTRNALARGLRQRGVAVGTAKVARLLVVLKSERLEPPDQPERANQPGENELTAESAADRVLALVVAEECS
jgi:hypothetical protein